MKHCSRQSQVLLHFIQSFHRSTGLHVREPQFPQDKGVPSPAVSVYLSSKSLGEVPLVSTCLGWIVCFVLLRHGWAFSCWLVRRSQLVQETGFVEEDAFKDLRVVGDLMVFLDLLPHRCN